MGRFGPSIPGNRRDRSRFFAYPSALPITPPFVGGYVTDVDQYQLAPNESPLLQDVIWPKGVPCLRGNWSRTGVASLFGDANALAGVMAVQFAADGSIDLIVTNTAGKVGLATSGRSGVATIPTGMPTGARVPRAVYQGEALIPSLDGITPVLRYVLHTGTPTLAAGTVSMSESTSLVTGTGSTFTTQAPAGTYFSSATNPLYASRVLKVESATVLSLAFIPTLPGFAAAGDTFLAASCGFMGLLSEVTRIGSVDVTNGSTTVTGHGTSWNTALKGNGKVNSVQGTDWLVCPGVSTSSFSPARALMTPVGLVSSDTSMVVSFMPVITTTAGTPYIIGRPVTGRDVCVHQSSVFIASPDWARRRIFMLPPGADLGVATNSIDPKYQGADRFAKYMDVPGADTPGRVEALLSGGEPGPLLVLATEAAYGVWTTYPPSPSNTTIRLIGAGLGCTDLRSAVSSEYGQFWAGDDHIASFQGGRCLSLTEGRRGREWRALMKARSSTAIVCAWVVNGHLFVALNDPSGPQSVTWCYDLNRKVWCGNITGLSPRAAHSARPSGFPQEAYVVTNETTGQQVGAVGAVALDEGAANGTNQGTFIAETSAALLGDPVGLSRPIDMKVKYELTGTGGTMTVKTSDGPSTAVQEAAIAVPASNPDVQRIRPQTDVTAAAPGFLGRQLRNFKVRVEGSGSPSKLRVHEIELELRQPWRRQ